MLISLNKISFLYRYILLFLLLTQARIPYNLGLLLRHLKRDSEAEAELSKAVTLEPDNMDYLYALTEYYLKRGKFQEAKPIAEQMVARHPAMQVGHNMLSITGN